MALAAVPLAAVALAAVALAAVALAAVALAAVALAAVALAALTQVVSASSAATRPVTVALSGATATGNGNSDGSRVCCLQTSDNALTTIDRAL